MTNSETIEEEQFPKLRLLQGGKGPPINTKGEDWLSKLSRGSVFSCSQKGNDLFVLGMFCILHKHDKTIILGDALGNGPNAAVDPVRFCKKHDLHEVFQEGSEFPEGDNNDGSGSIRPSGVADDEDAPGRQPEHDGSER